MTYLLVKKNKKIKYIVRQRMWWSMFVFRIMSGNVLNRIKFAPRSKALSSECIYKPECEINTLSATRSLTQHPT